MSIQERAFGEAMDQLGVTKAVSKPLLQALMSILLEEQDKMLRSAKAQLCENGSAGSS